MQIFLVFFLWDAVFKDPGRVVFGYNREGILTYVLGLIIVKSFVFSSKSMDVAGEISRGELSNYLVKPVSYFKYWITRDLSSKSLNLSFAFFETLFLFLILKPSFFIQTDPILLIFFLLSLILAFSLFSLLLFIVSAITFWMPEAGWGAHFLISIISVEFMSGALFPLDILPHFLQRIVNYTPFPYMVFFPMQVYLGKILDSAAVKGILISGLWILVLYFIMTLVWRKGLKVYEAYGR